MADTPLVYRSATELASLIRDGRFTAVQIVEAHLRQIRKWNPQLHAVVSVREAEALREAELAEAAQRDGRPIGPLHGLPITLKDSLRVRGVRSTFGGEPQRNGRAVLPVPRCLHRSHNGLRDPGADDSHRLWPRGHAHRRSGPRAAIRGQAAASPSPASPV